MEPVAATSKAQQGLWLFALAAFAAATVWINYEVKVKVQGGQGSGSVLEMGNVKVNQPAPDFSALDLSGNAVSLASFRGHKVVLLDFWATWCGPCRMAMVALQDLQDKYKNQGLEILSLNQAKPPTMSASSLTARNMAFMSSWTLRATSARNTECAPSRHWC